MSKFGWTLLLKFFCIRIGNGVSATAKAFCNTIYSVVIPSLLEDLARNIKGLHLTARGLSCNLDNDDILAYETDYDFLGEKSKNYPFVAFWKIYSMQFQWEKV